MKKILFECVGGASGDMILASLVDLGADIKKISEALKSICTDKEDKFTIKTEKTVSNGITGTRADVVIPYHHHSHHHHRGFDDIKKVITQSELSDFVKQKSIAIFKRLGEAEAKIHGKTLDEIHFHEVGALDSIIDIVGSCLALEQLNVSQIAVGALLCGHGTIKCAHGILPNPAPAMLLLAEGHKIEYVDEPFELVTPTAAAFFTTDSSSEQATRDAILLKIGYGIGHRTLNYRPNALRASLLEVNTDRASSSAYEECILLESNIDDMPPQMMGALFEKLLRNGALDVFLTPIQMKKQRPGVLLNVLCNENSKAKILEIIFTESTTFGIREYNIKRHILRRDIKQISTDYGDIRIKIGYFKGNIVSVAPEYEDCIKISSEKNVPLKKIYEAAIAAISNQNLQKG